MTHSIGEIDRSLAPHDLLVSEFDRFLELQRHYNPNYPASGPYRERTAGTVVFPVLKDLGSMARIGSQLAVPEGACVTAPLDASMEHKFPVIYRYYSASDSPYKAKPVVVADRIIAGSEGLRLSIEGQDVDDFVEIGLGVRVIKDTYEHLHGTLRRVGAGKEVGGFAISLTSTLKGDVAQLSALRTIYSKRASEGFVQTNSVDDIPDEVVQEFAQHFRKAAWESVSEPA